MLNIFGENEKIVKAKEQVKKVYLADDRPWVVGYSGGKDSTAVVQLVFSALSELEASQLKKMVYIISSDTLVETPMIISSITNTLGMIQDEAMRRGLPIETHKVRPELKNTFWVTLIGRGYPSPRQKFRWCTDRLKIDPANRFILDKVSKYGEVIMVLGVRETESSTRAGVIKSHSVEGKVLMKHSSLPNAYVFAPIREFTMEDVWQYLLEYESPWGGNNHDLLQLYQDSSSECPLIVDKEIKESAGSCGNSRFGCWTCTVVKEDKALTGFINSGVEWLKPLLEFRNYLAKIRSDRSLRQKQRTNGQIYLVSVPSDQQIPEDKIKTLEELKEYIQKENIDLAHVEELEYYIRTEDGSIKQLGLGPFTLKAREEILRRLLQTQKKVQEMRQDSTVELISLEELKLIRRLWKREGDWEDQIPKIYYQETGIELDWEQDDRPQFKKNQITDLERLCEEYGVPISLIKKLIAVEREYSGYKIRRGLYQEFDRILDQEILHL
ncbi:DNA phosphorothioation system sulfurtransferase DndC [Thermoactinomyces sp. CICC 10521]|uniref:DNA phosphorothioation system sulfurtransferase DndC n=1 Tax=Thermoactinomyces sp. CICC 10521 TaxID=2767426 RepID=UPI0018DB050E|nr:DNA phosphorothioation system sulfurtransferase DndC [Thermoactinomyces sp. CICC 10521]MBH8608232.1 DNA phosphorothioation system sulfurtransferase DndC [Thermoactinomyces sp. CICC 10521]